MHVIMSYPLILYFYYCKLTIRMTSSLSLRSILDANKLTGPNYVDWLRNLSIILTQEKVSYILDTPVPDSLRKDAFKEEKATYNMQKEDSVIVKCIMLASMSNELLRQHEDMDVPSIVLNPKEFYGEQSRTARYEISKQLFYACMTEGTEGTRSRVSGLDLEIFSRSYSERLK